MVTLAPTLARRLPFYYGWVVILVAGLVSFTAVSFGPGVVGALFLPMSEEFGWSRSIVSGAVVVGSFMVVVVGPTAGRLVDRYGARPVTTVGSLIMGLCLLGLSFTNSVFMFYAIFGVGYSMFTGLSRVALAATTAQWFVRRRGVAMSLASASTALGFVVLPMLAALVIGAWGWRAGWLAVGLVTLLTAVPTSFFLLMARPADVGQRVDGDRSELEEARINRLGRSAAAEVQWTVREAMKTSTMWILLLALSIQALAVGGVTFHLVPHLQDRGLPLEIAVLTFTFAGIGHAVSAYFWGWASDRLQSRYIYAISSMVLILFVFLLMLADNVWMAILVGSVQGVGFGGFALVMRVAYANYFGRRSAGAIQGFVTPVQVLVGGSGTLVAGLLFDVTGSYAVPFSAFMALIAVAILVALLVPTPVKRERRTGTVSAGQTEL